jgi:hypothetical protein
MSIGADVAHDGTGEDDNRPAAMTATPEVQPEASDTPDQASAPGPEDLATRWLEAEARARTEPTNVALAEDAVRLGEEYDAAVTAASVEDLRLGWEAARRLQEAEEIGSQGWGDARRVAELLRTEYQAAKDRPTGT